MTTANTQPETGATPEPKRDEPSNWVHRMVRPIGFPPQVWSALMEVRAAQAKLEDDYPKWNASGKEYAVRTAAAALRHAHAQLMNYVAEVSSHDA